MSLSPPLRAACQVTGTARRIWCSASWAAKYGELFQILETAINTTPNSRRRLVENDQAYAEAQLVAQTRRTNNTFAAIVTAADKQLSQALGQFKFSYLLI